MIRQTSAHSAQHVTTSGTAAKAVHVEQQQGGGGGHQQNDHGGTTGGAEKLKSAYFSEGAAQPGVMNELPPLIRDRIKELRRVPAGKLRANVKNWRLHPEGQKSAMRAMLEDVGFVGALLAREVNGELELLDGHLRADIASDVEVPVLIVDVNDQEADKVLATFDPLSGMALVNTDALGALLGTVELDDHAELRRMLVDLQDVLVEEEEKAADENEREIPGMQLRPHEHYDYLVVLASTAQEWNVICERLKLVPEKRRGRMGTCRAIHARRLLELLASAEDGAGKRRR